MTHTATPWTLRHVSGSNFANQEFEIRGMLGKHEGKAVIFNKDKSAIDGQNIYMRPEDAEFIVRACNAHDPYESLLRDVLCTLHPHDPLRARILDELSKHGEA